MGWGRSTQADREPRKPTAAKKHLIGAICLPGVITEAPILWELPCPQGPGPQAEAPYLTLPSVFPRQDSCPI